MTSRAPRQSSSLMSRSRSSSFPCSEYGSTAARSPKNLTSVPTVESPSINSISAVLAAKWIPTSARVKNDLPLPPLSPTVMMSRRCGDVALRFDRVVVADSRVIGLDPSVLPPKAGVRGGKTWTARRQRPRRRCCRFIRRTVARRIAARHGCRNTRRRRHNSRSRCCWCASSR